jgi:minor histocompatibility antigen H13
VTFNCLNLPSCAELFKLRLTVLHPPLIATACSLVGLYLYTRHWVPSNILALSLSLSSISMLSLDSFQTGSIMLTGLFLYDIFWVFGTNVMVSVARGFDGPIKIVWPKNFVMGLMESNVKWQMTMLGLGDIVIPGIFIALALRFDQHQFIQANPSKMVTKRDIGFAKPYFQATMVAYVLGLATTMGVMHFTKAAQPALLYLSPACIAAVVLCAVKRGEVKEMWAWKDEGEPEEKDKSEAEDVATSEDKSSSTGTKVSTRSTRRRKVSSSK